MVLVPPTFPLSELSLIQDRFSGQGGPPWLGHVLSGLFHTDNQSWQSEHQPGFCPCDFTPPIFGSDLTTLGGIFLCHSIAHAVICSPWCLSLPEHTWGWLCGLKPKAVPEKSAEEQPASGSTQPPALCSQGMCYGERICKVRSLLAPPGTALNGTCPALSCGISSNWCLCALGLMEVFYTNCAGFGVCLSSGSANYLSPMDSNMLYHIQADILIMYYSLCWRN